MKNIKKQRKFIVFLDGDTQSNVGPANVNKKIIENPHFLYSTQKNKIKRTLETINKMKKSNLILFSGIPQKSHVMISKLLRKKSIYLMHGFLKYDNEINCLNLNPKEISKEKYLLDKVDLILCVSEKFSLWFLNKNPQYENKIYYINCGIEIDKELCIPNERHNILAVAGGNRNIKNNKIICDIVNHLNNNGIKCKINVFGQILSNNEKIIPSNNVTIVGQVEQKNFYEELKKTKLFILNTSVESFGLSVIDALICGCDILVPYNSGVTSILNLEENDVIYNYDDREEISKKIVYNLNYGNNRRIIRSIDFDHYSWANVTERLIDICCAIYNDEDYTNIK